MHIPDGYLSPQTFIPAYAVMIPFWAWASSKLKRTLRMRQVPMLALGAAFIFVIMMFNIPLGPSSGHAVGAVLIAILLSPWAALIAVSLALAVQALLFGDGGITAFGANCLTMALIMPFIGSWVYHGIAGHASATAYRRVIAAAIAGYVALNAAALATGFLFGIQPLIASDGAGRALYNPFPLGIALPVMAAEHLLLFGFVEAIVTGAVIAYFTVSAPEMLSTHSMRTTQSTLWHKLAIGLGAIVLLTPLGLLAAGTAWGEWGLEELQEHAGYLPSGMAALAERWQALLPDYSLPGLASAPFWALSLAYVLSAVVGIGIVIIITLLMRPLIAGRDTHDHIA